MDSLKNKYQLLLENTFQTLFSILKIFILVRRKGAKIHQYTQAKHFVVLGNGPSLEEEIKNLKFSSSGTELVCVNFFPITNLYEQLKPSFFVTSAPELWLEDVEQSYLNTSNQLFETIARKTSWKLFLFIPFDAKKYTRWRKILAQNTNIKICYYNNNAVEGLTWFNHFCFNLQIGMPRPHNVILPCLSLTISKHTESILLLGVGHTWLNEIHVTQQNDVLLNQKHFYDKETSKPETMKKLGKGKRKLHEVLHKFMLTFYGYFVINEYAHKQHVKVFNGTEISFIDAFERISPKEYLEKIRALQS